MHMELTSRVECISYEKLMVSKALQLFITTYVPCPRRQEEGPAAVVVVGRGLVALVLGGGGHGVLGR